MTVISGIISGYPINIMDKSNNNPPQSLELVAYQIRELREYQQRENSDLKGLITDKFSGLEKSIERLQHHRDQIDGWKIVTDMRLETLERDMEARTMREKEDSDREKEDKRSSYQITARTLTLLIMFGGVVIAIVGLFIKSM